MAVLLNHSAAWPTLPFFSFSQLMNKRLTNLIQINIILPALVVGKCKRKSFPRALVIGHRHLGVHVIADIDAMGKILRRSQYQFRRFDHTGVKIDRPRVRRIQLLRQLLFHLIRLMLDRA